MEEREDLLGVLVQHVHSHVVHPVLLVHPHQYVLRRAWMVMVMEGVLGRSCCYLLVEEGLRRAALDALRPLLVVGAQRQLHEGILVALRGKVRLG